MYTNCFPNIRHCKRQHDNMSLTMSLSDCDEAKQPIQSCYACFLFVFLFFFNYIFSLYFFLKDMIFSFSQALNEKSKFDSVHVIVKIKITSPPETITGAIRKAILVGKGLAYDNTSSVIINFYNEFCYVAQKDKAYIRFLHMNNLYSERFLETTKHTQIKLNELATIDTPDDFRILKQPSASHRLFQLIKRS